MSRWVEARLGLHFMPRQWPELQRGLELAARRLGWPDAETCAQRALDQGLDPAQLQVLTECLAIGETYFFRDPAVFDALWSQALLPLVAARRHGTRHLRLWSAGCSTGEEAWSLAMLVASRLPDWRDWQITILGTDINDTALQRAQAGVYGAWSLRGGVPAQAMHFLHSDADGKQHIAFELRGLVRFARLNLAADDYPSAAGLTLAMDLVLCRNVLIYFEPPRARAVLARLGRSLVQGGWLVTGPVEIPREPVPGLALVEAGGLMALRQGAGAVATGVAVPAASPVRVARSAPTRSFLPALLPAPLSTLTPPRAHHAQAPPSDALCEARASADLGDLARAEQLCRHAMAQDKLNPQWSYLLATILSEQGATDQAQEALQRTLYLDADHLLARIALGSLALRQGHVEQGRKHLRRVLARLAGWRDDAVLPGSGGLSASQLQDLIQRAGVA